MAIVATPQVLRFFAHNDHIAVAYEEAGQFPSSELSVPLALLAACESRHMDSVELTSTGAGAVRAHWTEEGVEQTRVVEYSGPPSALPSLPPMSTNPVRLLSALRDAAITTNAGMTRYALGCIQIRGKRGEIVATDGHQLLQQRGFTFPFEDDILVGHHDVFGANELLAANEVSVGLRDDWFVLQAGAWTIQIKIETGGRFPRVDDVIPVVGSAIGSCRLSPTDCKRLQRALPLLPGNDDRDSPVTVDFDGRFMVRAMSSLDERPIELALAGHTPRGAALRIAMNRCYLQRAGKLNLSELHLFSARTPVHACDDLRSYIWMPLAESVIVPPAVNKPLPVTAAA